MDNLQKWTLAGVAVLVLFQLLSFFNIGQNLGVGAPFIEDYDPFVKTYGINTEKDITTTGTLTAVAATLTGTLTGVAATLSGLLTTDAGILRSYTLATSTSASMTLKQSDITGYDTVVVSTSGAAATKTITFPATSTLTSFIPTVGDMAEQCWFNATTTAASTLTFAAGTGIDLEVATSTAQTGAFDLVLGANNMGCFTYLRKADTDVVVGFLEYSDAD